MESSDSNSVVHMTNLVIDAPGIASVDSQTGREEETRDASLESECCRVKAFFETCQEADASEGSVSVSVQSSDLQVAEVDTTCDHVKYRPEVEDITNDSVDLYGDLGKMTTEHSMSDKEVALPQENGNADTVSHELFNDNAMDLSLVEDSSPPGTHKYPSSFGINLNPDSDTGSKHSPSCKQSNHVDGKITQSNDNFLSPVTATTSKAHSLCSSSSPHNTHRTRRIVPMSSPLKSPGWRDYFRSPVRSPKVRRLIRQKMKKASFIDEMNREQSLSDSEVEDVNESSRLSALDLYTDVLEDSVQVKYQGEIRKLQEEITQHSNKLEEMNVTTNDLREQLKFSEAESEKVKAENVVLRMNISRLMKTAQQEMRSKHREILNLELRLKNGGNEELLRRVIPYQPYTGKGSSCNNDSVNTWNMHNIGWSSNNGDGNSTKRRPSVRETALTIMKEVKDAVCGREENAAVQLLSSTAHDPVLEIPVEVASGDIIQSPVEVASGDAVQSHVEAAINDIKQSSDSSSKFTKTASVKKGLEDKSSAESENEDWQGRCFRSSSHETVSTENSVTASHGQEEKSHDYHSKSAKDGSHEEVRQHNHDTGRRRRRYSRSSSCEKLFREREPTLHGKYRESHDYPLKSVNKEKRDKQEGHYEHEKRNRRRRISRSSSCEKLSREREPSSHGKNRKSCDYPSNLAREEMRHKKENEGNYEREKGDRRRRISRSSSCEKSSRERESSHGRDRKSHDFLSKSVRERNGHEKDRNDRLERSIRSRRISRSNSCDNLSKERELISGECERESHDYPSKSARGERGYEHESSDLGRRRYSRSSPYEYRERESASRGKDKKSEIEKRYELEKEVSLKTGKIERSRRYSRSSSCEKSSREREPVSHGKDKKSEMEQGYELEKERSLKTGKIERRRYSRSSSGERSSRERDSASHGKDKKSELEQRYELEKERSVKSGNIERRKRYSRSSSCEKSSREPASNEKDLKLSKEEKTGEFKKKESHERARRDGKRGYPRSSSCEKSLRERDFASYEKGISFNREGKRDDSSKKRNERAESYRKRRYSRSSSYEKERDRVSPEKDVKSALDEKRGECKKEEKHERAKRERKRKPSRSSSCEPLLRETESKFYGNERDLDGFGSKSSKKNKDEDGKAKSEDYKRRERQRGRRYSRSRSHDKASEERDIESDDEPHRSDNDNSKFFKKERNEKREWTRERKSRSSSCERSLRISGCHERDSDDYLTARRSHDHSSHSKKYDGDHLIKKSLEAERRSRSGSHERSKMIHSKDAILSDSRNEPRRRMSKESEKTEVSKQRKKSTLDSDKHICGQKDVRLYDEKESDDENDDVGSKGSKKYVKEDYREKESSSKERRWSPEIFESSKVSKVAELGKKGEHRDRKYEKQRGRSNLKSVSPELSSKRRKIADGDSGDMVSESSDYSLQVNTRHRKTIKSSEMEQKSDRMKKELRSPSNERSPEKSPRGTDFSKKERETRISSSKVETLDVFSEVREKRRSKIHGGRLDRKSNETEESEEMEKEENHERAKRKSSLSSSCDGGENRSKSKQKSDTDESDEEDFEVESEEFELIKSVGIEMSENIKNVDNAGKARRNVERLDPNEIEAELEGSESLGEQSEEEKDKDEMLRSRLKEPLKRKRHETALESKSDSFSKSSHDTSEIRRTRRKCEHYEHGTKDMEPEDSMSEKIVKKKTKVRESHSGSRLGDRRDYDDKGGLKKKTKKSKLRSRGSSMSEEICKRVEKSRSPVSRFTGDSMKSHEEEIRSHDVENESHDQSLRSTEVSAERDGETKKVLKMKKKKVCKPKVKSCKDRSTSAEVVKDLLEKKEQSDDMPIESLSDIDKESKNVKENEISSQLFLEGRKDFSPEVIEIKKKEQKVEMLRDNGTEEETVDKMQSRSEEKEMNSGSSFDECFSNKIAVSDHVNSSCQQETMLIVKEHPLVSNSSNKGAYNSQLLSDLQMSSDTADDDDSKVQMFDELSLTCDGQIFLSSDGEHLELGNKDGQKAVLSFADNFQNDHKIDSCEEKVSEVEGINAQEENLSVSPMQEAKILGQKDDFKIENCSSSQNGDQEAPEDETVHSEEFHVEDRHSNESSSENNLENKFKYERKTEEGIMCLVSSKEGEISNALTGERTSIEVTSQNSHQTKSGDDGESLQENGDEVYGNGLKEEAGQQRDEIVTTSAFQMKKREDVLLDVLDSSKTRDRVLNESSPDQGEASCQNRNDLSVVEHINQTGGSALCTPSKGPFTFEQGHTVISCGKPFTKIVGSIPEEETLQEEVEFGTVQEEDAINVYVSDSSLTDPFSPDKCKKDLFKDKTGKKKTFTPEKVKKKLLSVVVSSRSDIRGRSRSSSSKMKVKDQDVLRKRIVSRYAGRERSVSQMRPLSSKRELAKKYLQRAKHVQRSKPHESWIKSSPERGRRYSDDLRNLILKHERMSESRHTYSPSYNFDPLRDLPQNRWERRKVKSVKKLLAAKGRLEERKREERRISKQRSHRNSGKIIEDGNRDLNNESSSKGKRGKLSEHKEEKKVESVTEKEETVKPVKKADTSLSDGEIRSDSDENSEDERVTKKSRSRTERTISVDRDKKRTRQSSRHSSSRRTSRRR